MRHFKGNSSRPRIGRGSLRPSWTAWMRACTAALQINALDHPRRTGDDLRGGQDAVGDEVLDDRVADVELLATPSPRSGSSPSRRPPTPSVRIPADARTDDTRVDKTIERIARSVNQPAIGARAHVNDVRARGLAGLAHVTSLTVATGPRGRINPPVPPIEMPRDLAFCQSTCRDIDHDSVVRRDEPQLTRPSPVASSLAETRSLESAGFDIRASLSSGSRSR